MLDNREVRARTRRPRRTSEELRRTILEQARHLFAQNGYQGVSTRTIAAAAGASESLIFTNWGGKSALFRAAVLEPFEQFVADYRRQWASEARSETLEHEARTYITGMYDLFHTHRRLVLALVAAQAFERGAIEGGITDIFRPLLQPIADLVAGECARRGWRRIDPSVITSAMTGMVVSMTVLDDMLHSEDTRPSREHAIDQMTLYWVNGMGGIEHDA